MLSWIRIEKSTWDGIDIVIEKVQKFHVSRDNLPKTKGQPYLEQQISHPLVIGVLFIFLFYKLEPNFLTRLTELKRSLTIYPSICRQL
jgi:hypothetical protein